VSTAEAASLLLEIGCEEIPARFVAGAERDLGELLAAALQDARLLETPRTVKTGSTPRRLVAYVPALLKRQPDRVHQVLGPSVKAAFDEQGRPKRAAEAFAAKHHVKVSDLSRIHNAKGEYVVAELREDGSKAIEVLRELLPDVIGDLSFPKSMYWTVKAGPCFIRPIRWILALLGEAGEPQVVPFEFAGVHSGSFTFGHRLKGSQPIEITDLNLDLKLKERWVVLSAADRRERIREEIHVLVEDKDWAVPRDEYLEDWVVSSTEWPVSLMGSFDLRYLALPREVLVTVMRDHQKYFGVEDKAGNLRPHFITVLNVPGDPKGLIRQGHERVLAARFADAEFFWNADQKISLADRVPMLEGVMYHERIGTYGDKVRRMSKLAGDICGELEKLQALSAEERRYALGAVELCKCDLTTQMVQEFTELEGVVGGLYARAQGAPAEVAGAIYDHYRPRGTDDSNPRSVVGAIVSMADKLDTVTAGFAAGLAPTGSSDPFALRRAGNGVIRLAIESLAGINLAAVMNRAVSFAEQTVRGAESQNLAAKMDRFWRERMEFYFREVARLRYDTARAVLSPTVIAGTDVPSAAMSRARGLERIRDTEDFLALAAAAKRTRNILTKSAEEQDVADASRDINPALFTERPESDLHNAYEGLKKRLELLSESGNYDEAFRALATIRPQVDLFFDKVLVIAEDPAVRRNRLMLLLRLNEDVFTNLADLAEVAVEPSGGTATNA
jgi:glycyl-tRNA synthetase beta chain